MTDVAWRDEVEVETEWVMILMETGSERKLEEQRSDSTVVIARRLCSCFSSLTTSWTVFRYPPGLIIAPHSHRLTLNAPHSSFTKLGRSQVDVYYLRPKSPSDSAPCCVRKSVTISLSCPLPIHVFRSLFADYATLTRDAVHQIRAAGKCISHFLSTNALIRPQSIVLTCPRSPSLDCHHLVIFTSTVRRIDHIQTFRKSNKQHR